MDVYSHVSIWLVANRVRTRKEIRRSWAVAVRVVCDRCGGLLAELYGPTGQAPVAYWSRNTVSGLLVGYGRAVRWRCRRGHDHPMRAEKLTTAYRVVAVRPDPRDRVIRLPRDVAGVAGTSPSGDPIV